MHSREKPNAYKLLFIACKLMSKMKQRANLNSPLSICPVSVSKLTTNQMADPTQKQRMWKIFDILYKYKACVIYWFLQPR